MSYSSSLSLFFCLVISVAAYTQDGRPRPHLSKNIDSNMVHKEVESLKVLLNLTESQTKEVAAVENGFYRQYVVFPNPSASGVARKERIKELQKNKEEALKRILTPDQWRTYMSYMEERQKKVRAEIEQERRKLQDANSGKQG